ncbi:hypothetical protein R1flu_007270 [Riccia fluitans]|uniref:BED-type domain-containing protein n=1 Tax=Riccia fluitans TaxID=41844 RepID=A0ABD1YYC6_9MARC
MDGLGDVGTRGGRGLQTLTSVMEVQNSNNNLELQMPGKLFYPSLSHLFLNHLSTRSLGCQNLGNNYPLKSWSSLFCLGKKNHVDDVWCKCKWCGNLYGPNVTRLTQHFTSEFAPRQRGNMELPAFRREGSNRHIKDCERASEQLKLEIRGMNNRERERAAELASLHDMESTSHALDKEEREIKSAFPGNIWVNLFQHM